MRNSFLDQRERSEAFSPLLGMLRNEKLIVNHRAYAGLCSVLMFTEPTEICYLGYYDDLVSVSIPIAKLLGSQITLKILDT